MGLDPDPVVLVLHGAPAPHLLHDLGYGREPLGEHDLHGAAHLDADGADGVHAAVGDGLRDKADVACDVERPLDRRPVLLGGERLRQRVQDRHVRGPDPHPSGDRPAQVPGLHGVGVVQESCEGLLLDVLGVLALGPLDGRQPLHHPGDGELLGEQRHLLLLGDEGLRDLAQVPGLNRELLHLVLRVPGGLCDRLHDQPVSHPEHPGHEVGVQLPLAEVHYRAELALVSGAEEAREYGGHLETAAGRLESVEGVCQVGVQHDAPIGHLA